MYLSVLTEDDRERLRVRYDTVCQTFGQLYAVDAATMPFDLFASRIREWNYFPARLAWDATCAFVTPEEPPRGFDFWNRPEQFKRVQSLPLVDGPYLTADGHSGRIEIRAPRQPPEDRLPGPRPPRRRGPGAHRQRDVLAPAGHRPRAGRRSASVSGGPRPPRMRRAAGGGMRAAGYATAMSARWRSELSRCSGANGGNAMCSRRNGGTADQS